MDPIRNRGRPSIRLTAAALAGAVAATHAAGIAHRDCAPSAVHVEVDGRPLTRAEKNAALRRRVESTEPNRTGDVIEDVRGGEEDDLLGLAVEGRRIAILIDRSASMTDERLIDIIDRKVRSDADKRRGVKWRRTLPTVRWLLHRLPAGSEVAVVAFNDEATYATLMREVTRSHDGAFPALPVRGATGGAGVARPDYEDGALRQSTN